MRESPQAADTTGSQCNHITRRPQRERPARGPAQRGSTACASRRRGPTRQDRNATTLQGGRGVSARTKIDPVGVEPALLANAVRMLAADAVERAKSGHPGAPLGMAEIAEALWRRHLKHNPANPAWPDRDRFVLSNGHGSMLLYALLHLTGYDLPLDELKRFRQLHSRTPGHPECGVTPGVETTTGPLGQGLANAVGMALAEKLLAAHFNRPGLTIVDHRTYAFVGDGCLMEGVSHEACSLAGTLGLRKLIVLYDDNGISIDGAVSGWFRDDTPKRFEAYGWNVIRDVDGHDAEAVDAAVRTARACADRPTLVCCKTVIGRGAPTKAGSHDVHGAPLGASEIAAMRAALGWPHGPFEIPAEIAAAWDARPRGALQEQRWRETFDRYARAHPALAAEFERRVQGMLPDGWDALAASLFSKACAVTAAKATRKLSQEMLDELVAQLPELLGGSADLTGSNLTAVAASRAINGNDGDGNYLHYGVREFGMAAAMNGVALHGGFIPYGGTFLVFSDYARNAIRMSALTRQDAESGPARAVVIATGTEVAIALDAQRILADAGIAVRVVSMPCTSVFDRTARDYRDAVLPPSLPCVSIEAGVTSFWRAYIGREGLALGIDRFGESAPASELFAHFGLTATAVAAAVRGWIAIRETRDAQSRSPARTSDSTVSA